MIISVASGKGGTGKTTIALNLALSIEGEVQLLDCDVEEPNAHIFLKVQLKQRDMVTTPIPKINEERCTLCGVCQRICAYNAIIIVKDRVLVFPELCHSCGGCSLFCPENAIVETNKEIGYIDIGNSDGISFIQGTLNIGEAMPTPLIKAVKKNLDSSKIVIIDSPPGTSCPVIESVKGSDFCILVTEPTPFGLNDLILAVGLLRELNIPFGVVINKADIGSDEVENYCKSEGVPVLMKIPFKREIAEAYSKGIPLIEAFPDYREDFKRLIDTIEQLIIMAAQEASNKI
jgi:MinD superfamily P-loop ATPase